MSNITSRTSQLEALRNKIQERTATKTSSSSSSNYKNDERFWKPEIDKAGTGSAVIRFLNAKVGEEFPYAELYTHAFQGPEQKWFIDNCPSSLPGSGAPSDACPACADNNRLWNASKDKEDPRKKIASAHKRKLNYISNILVVSDPKHPENNGKVFLFKYGVKIFKKLMEAIDPPFADLEAFDPFSLEYGANFKLRVVREDGFPNYDKSSFDSVSAVGSEDRIAEIESQLHSIESILDPKNFKSYEKLEERFKMVMASAADDQSEDEAAPVAKPAIRKTLAAKPAGKTAAPKAAPVADAGGDDDDDYFARLAKADDE